VKIKKLAEYLGVGAMSKLVIPGKLPGLNDYIEACRANKYAGAEMKQQAEEIIRWEVKRQLRRQVFTAVALKFSWYEPNRKRDKDNIAFAKKFILDAMQATGTLTGDGWGQVVGFRDEFYVDKQNPRVEIEIEAV
jgi:hypothetical protein